MRYLNVLMEEQIGQKGLHIPEKMIAENTIMQNFKSAGYKVIKIQKPFEEEAMSSSSLIDLVLCKRSKYIDSQLLSLTVKTSILVLLVEKWEQQDLRDAALCQFSELP